MVEERDVRIGSVGFGIGIVAAGVLFSAPGDAVSAKLATGFIAQPQPGRYWAMASSYRAGFSPDGIQLLRHGRRAAIRFPGANLHWRGEGESTAQVTFLGAPANPPAGNAALRAANAFPGVDIVVRLHEGHLKSEFQLAPGVSSSRAAYCIDGAAVKAANNGQSLHFDAGDGWQWDEEGLESWQTAPDGRRIPVATRFAVRNNCVRFRPGKLDPALPLTIDPDLVFSSYLGGGLFDAVTAVAADSQGSIYLGGWTESSDFPNLSGYQTTTGGRIDGFIAKINPAGQLVYATYLGGSSEDRVQAIALDSASQITAAGFTSSTNFPTLLPARPSLAGNRDAFVARLNSAGNALIYSTYLGGTGNDTAWTVALDATGIAAVGGETASTDFPVAGAISASNNGGVDAFVTRISTAGAILSSTYLGGSGDDRLRALVFHSDGTMHGTGSTTSPNFPVVSALYPSLKGAMDAFYVRINPPASGLWWSTYLGGTGGSSLSEESGYGITIDSSGRAWIAGVTPSTDFPGVSSGTQSTYGGGNSDAFVSVFSAVGALQWSTYIGGSGIDGASAISAGAGFVGLAGYSTSTNLPVTAAAPQPARSGDYDAFWAAFPMASTTPLYISYLGGGAADSALGAAAAGSSLAIGGSTLSSNFPLASPLQVSNGGAFGGFASRFRFGPGPLSVSPSTGSGMSQTFTFTLAHANGNGNMQNGQFLFNATNSLVNGCYFYFDRTANRISLFKDAGSVWLNATVGSATPLDNGLCSTNGAGVSATTTANNLIVTLPVTFSASFLGARNVYASSDDTAGIGAGWPQVGAWTVAAPAPPTVGTVTPATGAGQSQVFSFTFNDPNGAADITSASLLLNYSLVAANGCYISFNRAANTISLLNDATSAYLPVTLGDPAVVENPNCSITGSGATITSSGTQLTLTVPITFKTGFIGLRAIYALASDAANLSSGWQQVGTWSPFPNYPPSFISASPTSGAGFSQVFTVVVGDANGAADLTSASFLFNTTATPANGCYIVYNRATNQFGLRRDSDGATLLINPGSIGLVENPNCQLTGAALSVTASGNQLTFTLPITFKSGFAGVKTFFAAAGDAGGLSSGWVSAGSWSASLNYAPTISSVTPSSGAGATQSFAVVFTDANGAADITSASFLFNTTATPANGCYIVYSTVTNQFSLLRDSDGALLPISPGAGGLVENANCQLAGAGLTVSSSGTQLLFTLPVTFKTSFTGVKTFFAAAGDSGGLSSGWVSAGSWSGFINYAPAVTGVSPSSGSGPTPTFTLVVSDANGAADLASASFLVNTTATPSNGCYIVYTKANNQFSLFRDSDGATLPISPGASGLVENANCQLSGVGLSTTTSGNSLTLTLPLTFKPAFAGARTLFAAASDTAGLNTNWQAVGGWNPGSAAAPTVTSVTPSAGTGLTQNFSFLLSDPNGFDDITGGVFLFNGIISGTNSCFLFYSRPANQVYLFRDSDGSWLSLSPGSPGSVANANCALAGTGLTVSGSGTNLTIVLPITFQISYFGAKNIYASATDQSNLTSGWITVGAWTPTSPPAAPTVVSVTPNSGSGSTQTFTIQMADANGASDISSAIFLLNSSINGNNGCYISVNRAGNTLYLFQDATNTWAPITPGSSATVSNANCTVSGTGLTMTSAGTTFTVSVPLTFSPAFTGTRNFYAIVNDAGGLTSGWVTAGTWNTNGTPSPPVVSSLSPNSGSGTSQVFSLTLSDPNGNQDIAGALIIINNSINGNNGCFLSYSRSSDTIYLFRDSDNTWQPLRPGASASVSNANCSLAGAGFTVIPTGNSLVLALPLTFTPIFSGVKNFYASVVDQGNLSSGWITAGTWSPSGTPAAPTVTSVSPNAGSGTIQTFTVTLNDANGQGDIAGAVIIINTAIDGSNACFFSYSRTANALYLFRDSDNAWLPLAAGSSATVANTKCSIAGGGFTTSGAGNALTITLPITFTAAFAGQKNIYVSASDYGGLSSGWVTAGTWNTSNVVNAPPTVQSVTPASGSGSAQTFSVTLADPNGNADIAGALILINNAINGNNACFLSYSRSANSLFLFRDSDNSWLPLTPGSASTVANANCTITGTAFAVTATGNQLTLTIPITFKPAFAGPRNIYVSASDAATLNTGWITAATWTVI